MQKQIFDYSPVEPAHGNVVKRHDDLVKLYQFLRGQYQERIDQAFDDASREIGFVVTTTAPYVLEIGRNGKVEQLSIGVEYLKGSVFEQKLGAVTENVVGEKVPLQTAGRFDIYLLWYGALKVRLRADWLEPAHPFMRADWLEPAHPYMRQRVARDIAVRPEVMEPVHWFDPSVVIAADEKLVIAAIDEVYPELRLADRLINARRALQLWPGTREPAHSPAQGFERLPNEALAQIAAVLRRFGF